MNYTQESKCPCELLARASNTYQNELVWVPTPAPGGKRFSKRIRIRKRPHARAVGGSGGGARAWRRHTCREAAVAVMGRGSKGAEMCASSGLVAAAEAFVRAELAGADGSHDFAHVERVRASAARLAADEGLGAADVAVAEVAALLHDVKGASQCRLPRSCLLSLERACEHPGTCIHPDGPVRSMCPAPHACMCTLSARTQTTSTAATLMRASLRRAPSSRTMALMQPSSTLSATSSSTWASRWGPAQHHVCAPPPIDDRALVGEPRAFVSCRAAYARPPTLTPFNTCIDASTHTI